ncbi:hypothetical protein ACFSWE_00975 [Leucobacter albus]|uniref:Fibronectin type-III domain-containing protein n=1 Tax=Leucobacter albus TaxID=272210 RepID=A0ABW3TQ47_9MICO
MSTLTRFGAFVAAAVAVSSLAPPLTEARAVDDPVTATPQAPPSSVDGRPASDRELEALGKSTGSDQYGLIGSDTTPLPSLYGVTVAADGSIWYANPGAGGFGRGIFEYPRGSFDPLAGDYLGGGNYAADGGGYLASAWGDPVRYANRDSTAAAPSGGSEPWAEPRGIEALPGGGVAVNDTNGNTNTPQGTILFYDSAHKRIGNAGFASNQGCTQLAAGELMWGPYFTVLGDRLYAPYELCNVVSVFSTPSSGENSAPLYRLTGERQVAGSYPNAPHPESPGDLAGAYGVSSDGTALYTTDLGSGRPEGGALQRWLIDDANESWQLDTDFGYKGAVFVPGTQLYNTAVDPRQGLFLIPGTGQISRLSMSGDFIENVALPGLPYDTARDVAFTEEGWLAVSVRAEQPLRLLAKSPDPLANLEAAAGTAPGSVTLSWDEVATEYGQAPVIDYVIESSTDGGASWNTVERDPSLDTSVSLTGLPGGEHSFRVAAYSEAGRGDAATVDGVNVAQIAPSLTVELTGTAPETTKVGAEVEWSATVKNTGNAPLVDVWAVFEFGDTDNEDGDHAVEIDELAVNETTVVPMTSTLTAEDVGRLSANNAVFVVAYEPQAGKDLMVEAEATVQLNKVTGGGGQGPKPDESGKGPLGDTGGGPALAGLALALLLAAGGAGGVALGRKRRRGVQS